MMFVIAGDVDIYVNGGRFQPGCESPDFSSVTSLSDLASVSVSSKYCSTTYMYGGLESLSYVNLDGGSKVGHTGLRPTGNRID